jgi:preprotein translocase subunit SecE
VSGEQRGVGQAGSELITAAFGLVAALAWNTAIQELFTVIFPEAGDLIAKFLYVVVVTVIIVFVTIRLGRLAERLKEQERGLMNRLRQ